MLEPFDESICFPQTWQSAACLSWETVFSYVTSYRAPQWGHLKVSVIQQIYPRQVSASRPSVDSTRVVRVRQHRRWRGELVVCRSYGAAGGPRGRIDFPPQPNLGGSRC